MNNCVKYDHINVIITTTYACNLDCVYCYNLRDEHCKTSFISLDVVRKLYEITIPFYKHVHFLWHGGEPLLLGKEFYEKAISLQKDINCYGTNITNSIQTNLTLLNDDLALFFVNNNIKIGSSFDGTTNGKTRDRTEAILDGYNLLLRNGGHNGFICVVQSNNIDCLIEDYEWFKTKKINYTLNMYLPEYKNIHDPLYVPSDHFITRIEELFEYWFFDKSCNISISFFDTFLSYILLKEKSLCCYNSCLGKHIGLRYDGSVFGCNRDFPEIYKLGNVMECDNVRDLFQGEGFNNLLRDTVVRRYYCKENCECFDFCAGGCNSVALSTGELTKTNDEYCKCIKAIYHIIEEKVEKWRAKSKEEIDGHLNPYAVYFFNEANRRKSASVNHVDKHTDEMRTS